MHTFVHEKTGLRFHYSSGLSGYVIVDEVANSAGGGSVEAAALLAFVDHARARLADGEDQAPGEPGTGLTARQSRLILDLARSEAATAEDFAAVDLFDAEGLEMPREDLDLVFRLARGARSGKERDRRSVAALADHVAGLGIWHPPLARRAGPEADRDSEALRAAAKKAACPFCGSVDVETEEVSPPDRFGAPGQGYSAYATECLCCGAQGPHVWDESTISGLRRARRAYGGVREHGLRPWVLERWPEE